MVRHNTDAPTVVPTATPTAAPTSVPTAAPTASPTVASTAVVEPSSGVEVFSGFFDIQGFGTVESFTTAHQAAFKTTLLATLSSSIYGLSMGQITLTVALTGRRVLAGMLVGNGSSGLRISFSISGISATELSSTATAIAAIGTNSSSFVSTLTAAIIAEGAAVPSGIDVLIPRTGSGVPVVKAVITSGSLPIPTSTDDEHSDPVMGMLGGAILLGELRVC
jgi:hypothetical protein